MARTSILSLSDELLLLVAESLHNIEDLANLQSTCPRLRNCLTSVSPNTVLNLAAVQSRVFFRPSPHFLVAATARELGNWARLSTGNEQQLVSTLQNGIDAVLDLALIHCGLTMDRIRELHQMRSDIFNPVEDIIDRCVGAQWYSTPDFWDGGVDDAYTISAEPSETLFHLAMYGELFGPDLESYLNQNHEFRRLDVQTRLEFIKYILPDFATFSGSSVSAWGSHISDIDPRREVKAIGPYTLDEKGDYDLQRNHNLALVWVLQSSRWKPHWKEFRAKVGPGFQEDFADEWWYVEGDTQNWRQRMWEAVMVCQGLEGLGMIRPGIQDSWILKAQEWKEKIGALQKEPEWVKVGRQATMEYPFLLGDLRICGSGFVMGT